MDAQPTHEAPGPAATPAVRIDEVFPPYRLSEHVAKELATFVKPQAELAAEPRQRDAFLLVALLPSAGPWWPAGYLKLQHGAERCCWIRELVVRASCRRRGIGRALVRRGVELVVPHEQLAIEVAERDDVAHRFLRACGLECVDPRRRVRRQRQRRLYEFRSFRPPAVTFQGAPRFTWPIS